MGQKQAHILKRNAPLSAVDFIVYHRILILNAVPLAPQILVKLCPNTPSKISSFNSVSPKTRPRDPEDLTVRPLSTIPLIGMHPSDERRRSGAGHQRPRTIHLLGKGPIRIQGIGKRARHLILKDGANLSFCRIPVKTPVPSFS